MEGQTGRGSTPAVATVFAGIMLAGAGAAMLLLTGLEGLAGEDAEVWAEVWHLLIHPGP